MEFQSIVSLLVCVVFFFATSGIPTAFANVAESRIATSKCTHDQLYTAGGEMLKCESHYIHQYLVALSKIYENGAFDLQEACEIHNEIVFDERRECALNFAQSCFPNYISDFITKLYDVLTLNCNHPTPNFNFTFFDQNEVQAVMKELIENCKNDPNCPQGFFSFDKQCSAIERLESLYKIDQCMNSIIVGQSFDDITPCKTLSKALDECFKENDCFSQREMEMARNLVAAPYKIGMESLTIITDQWAFGSLVDFVEFLHNDVTWKWNDYTIPYLPISFDPSSPILRQVLNMLDRAVLDYNTEDCELNRDE